MLIMHHCGCDNECVNHSLCNIIVDYDVFISSLLYNTYRYCLVGKFGEFILFEHVHGEEKVW